MAATQPPVAAARFYRSFYHWTTRAHVCSRISKTAHLRPQNQPLLPSIRRHLAHSYSTSTNPQTTANAQASSTAKESETLSTHMRHLMRRIPHPVVVLTASFPSPPPSPTAQRGGPPSSSSAPEDLFRGMTLSSFNTVALDPTPIVSFNIRTPSATYDAVRASGGAFLAHILAGSTMGARVADPFTKGNTSESGGPFAEIVKRGTAKVFSGRSSEGAPVIMGSGVVRVLRCRLLEGKSVGVGDHVVLLAEVEGIIGGGEGLADETMGLMYVDRGYKAVGEPIAVEDKSRAEVVAEELKKKKQMEEAFHNTLGLNVRTGTEHMDR